MRRIGISLFIASVVLGVASPIARADETTADAEGLFNAGRDLMQQSRFADACPKLAQSQRLLPAVGTALNLGLCYERLGHVASAVSAYQDAVTLASAIGPAEVKRIAIARDRLAVLEPRVARLQISIAEDTPGLVVKRDGIVLDRSQLGVPLPVDPIPHVIEASAPGQAPWRTTLIVEGDASTASVVVPALGTSTPGATAEAASRTASPVTPWTERTIALTVGLGAVGLVALSAGTVLALDAKSKYDDANSLCDDRGCAPQAASIQDGAIARGDVATALFVGGGVALAAAAVAWFVWPGAQPDSAGRTGVSVGLSLPGVVAQGRF